MGGGGGSGPTLQQQQLQTQQALATANLNLEENEQRKALLNSMVGTRVFKGSALSRALRGNTPGTGGETNAPAPSNAQTNVGAGPTPFGIPQSSLLDQGTGATPAGGAGASGAFNFGGGAGVGRGAGAGGGSKRGGPL